MKTIKSFFTFENIFLSVLFLGSVAIILALLDGCSEFAPAIAMAGIVIPGTKGGSHVVDGPLTTELTREASPSLLRNEIDERVTRIRPSATPIDQISRCAGARPASSMIVDYYSVDTKPIEAAVTEEIPEDAHATHTATAIIYNLKTSNDQMFEPSETILVPAINGRDATGAEKGMLILYVVSRNPSGGLNVIAVNGIPDDDDPSLKTMPAIPVSTKLVRMGRAAAELDVQTAQFNALPRKDSNNCQIFKIQVEESTYQKIASKEVGWTFSDQEESAIVDLRQGMERNFLFGQKARIHDPEKNEEIYLTGGIWNQAGADFNYRSNTDASTFIIGLTRMAFTGTGGSARKILVAGSDLIEYLNRMEFQKVIHAGDKVTRWGIDFREIQSKFGTLYVIHSEVFDSCGHSHDGLVIDPQYMTKYCHVPFRTERLDLKKSGVRNTNAVVVTEASCVVLRYPSAHVRVNYSLK